MEDRLIALLAPVVEDTGLEFWSLQLGREGGRQVVRVLIDRPEGVSDEDCRLASAAVSEALEAVDPFPGPYTLEVASPGVDRVLRGLPDYDRFAGNTARLRLKQPLDGRVVLEGVLRGVAEDGVLLDTGRATVHVPAATIGEGRLTWNGFAKRAGNDAGAARERRRDGQPITAPQ